jgi:pimeloyl-ACP methyl ester carboxylesterase
VAQTAQKEKVVSLFHEWMKDRDVRHEKEMRNLLSSRDKKVQVIAAAALCRAAKGPEVLPVLIKAFCSKEHDLQLAALYALSLMREPAQKAFLKILRKREHKSYHPRIIRFLSEQTTESTLNSLKRYVNSDDKEVAKSAIRAFAVSDVYDMEKQWGERDVAIHPEQVVPSLTVIVHGTWANDETWWRWPAEFPQYVDQQTKDVYKGPLPFKWSGDNTDEARREGGRALFRWMQEHPTEKLTVIAHSHGGNVAFVASQVGLKMQNLILLGTPIRTDYLPKMDNIQTIHNTYSSEDDVQFLGTLFRTRDGGRVLPEARENIEVKTASKNPHSELRTVPLWKENNLERILREG